MKKNHIYIVFGIFALSIFGAYFYSQTSPQRQIASEVQKNFRQTETRALARLQNSETVKTIPARFQNNPAFQLFAQIETWL